MKQTAQGNDSFVHTSQLAIAIPDLSVVIYSNRNVRVRCILGFEVLNIGRISNEVLDQVFLLVDGKMVEQTIIPDMEVTLYDGRTLKGPGFETIVEVTMSGIHHYFVAATRGYFAKERCLIVEEV